MSALRPPADPAALAAVPVREVLAAGLETRVRLEPGDRPLVEPGAAVVAGDPVAEQLRDRRVAEVDLPRGAERPVPGSRVALPVRGRGDGAADGELLAAVPGRGGRWRVATGTHRADLHAPVAAIVVAVHPGSEIRLRVERPALRGVFAAGGAARGRLELATDPAGELRPGGIDVGRAGAILVVGSRIDAEALTRARAMGVRGIVVASLPGKELRDFQASEARQRAGLHPPAPFGVLVIEGALRRSIPSPITAFLERHAGREVALLVDPPALVVDDPDAAPLVTDPAWVRVRSGPHAGSEGRIAGLAGLRRFDGGAHLEAVLVRLDEGEPVAIATGDLERYA